MPCPLLIITLYAQPFHPHQMPPKTKKRSFSIDLEDTSIPPSKKKPDTSEKISDKLGAKFAKQIADRDAGNDAKMLEERFIPFFMKEVTKCIDNFEYTFDISLRDIDKTHNIIHLKTVSDWLDSQDIKWEKTSYKKTSIGGGREGVGTITNMIPCLKISLNEELGLK